MNVTSLMRRAAEVHANRIAIVHDNDRITFAAAWERGCRFANGLISMGLRPGDCVAALEENSTQAADFFLGCAIANIVRVPLYPRNSREAHIGMLRNTDCRALFASADHAADVAGLEREVPTLEHVVVREDGYERWLASQSATDPMVPIKSDDLYIIRHTGGTTGRSRGVASTHRQWIDTGRDWFYPFPPVEPGDACLHVGPISHGSGYFFMPTWLGGGTNVMVGKFEPKETLEIMERERVGYSFIVPPILNALCQHPSAVGRDWSALKCLFIAGAPISDATALKAREVFGEKGMYQGYGLSEVLLISCMGPRQWFGTVEGSNPLRSCGLVMPYAYVEIWDDDHKPLSFGEVGQIVARTDGQMSGYWRDPEGTRERIVQGRVLTGDVGMIDRNGYLYLLDRADDMIISGGYNIWPMELENAIADHPSVLEVAVFGIPDQRWGETPCAVVVPKAGAVISEHDIIQICSDQLGSYKKPGKVVVRHEPLPKSPVGKIRRKDLRVPYWAGHQRRIGGT